jgi:hypothetical protein
MFPHSKYTPAFRPKNSIDPSVAYFVAFELFLPESGIVGWHISAFWAAMPEATIDEDGQALASEREVRPTHQWQVPPPA